MKVPVALVKAFSKNKEQGNPAGVVLKADDLTMEQMLSISASLGFSESAFIHHSEKADLRLRFFTPTQEVDLCGHATIAAIHAFAQKKCDHPAEKKVETNARILSVTCFPNDLVMMVQQNPTFFEPESDRRRISQLLSLQVNDLLDYPIQCVSTGTPKLIIPVKSLDRLLSIEPDLNGIAQYCKETTSRGFYPFTLETKDSDSDFHARQFNPLAGIDEDPVTGVAAGALACYAQKYALSPKTSLVIEQGFVLGKGGKVFADIQDSIQVGGYAVTFGEKEIEV